MSSQAGVDGRRGDCSFPEPLPGPPATAEEFLRPQKLENWPRAVTWDTALRLDSPFGMEEDSADENLRAAAPLDLVPLERLEERASRLACELRLLVDKVLLHSTEDQQQQRRWPKTQDAAACGVGTFIAQTDECDDVWSHKDNELTRIQDCSLPEFLGSDAVADLPQSLDLGHLLENCFDAQAFQPRRHWKQLFTSGSSLAIVRDTFWWIFLSRYKGGANQELEDHLYDRVAKSFVSLLLSTPPHNINNKDKFLQAYVEWLAQVLYGAFVKAFPASRLQFGDDFKAELANLTSLWICGIQAKPLSWKTWDLSWLGESLKTAQKTPTGERQRADAVLEISHLHDNSKPTVGTLPRFDVEAARADAARSGAPRGWGDPRELPSHAEARVASADTRESHLVGPGQSYRRVPFNVRGQSPLVAHVLQSCHLAAGRARRSRGQTRIGSARRRKSKATIEASEGTRVAWRPPVRHPGAQRPALGEMLATLEVNLGAPQSMWFFFWWRLLKIALDVTKNNTRASGQHNVIFFST
uniref:Protein FAM227B isoform X1 n=1 Tax=Petromyzon marinus TaxID=7757 RepID=A0AAJ7WQM5_PETMA|nr:protein FAM227B isoform X1 [Petromyzon marinus]